MSSKSNLIVLSYSNITNDFTSLLTYTLAKNNFEFKFVGYGEKWLNYMTKIKGYLNQIKTYNDDYVIALIDAFDVLINNSPEECLNKFNLLTEGGIKVLISSEKYCTAGEHCLKLSQYKNTYLNSGVIIGRKSNLIDALQWCIDIGETNDQLAMCKYAETHPQDVILDVNSVIAQTVNIFNRGNPQIIYNCKSNIIYNKLNNGQVNRPVFLHTPAMKADLFARYNKIAKCLVPSVNQFTIINLSHNKDNIVMIGLGLIVSSFIFSNKVVKYGLIILGLYILYCAKFYLVSKLFE